MPFIVYSAFPPGVSRRRGAAAHRQLATAPGHRPRRLRHGVQRHVAGHTGRGESAGGAAYGEMQASIITEVQVGLTN